MCYSIICCHTSNLKNNRSRREGRREELLDGFALRIVNSKRRIPSLKSGMHVNTYDRKDNLNTNWEGRCPIYKHLSWNSHNGIDWGNSNSGIVFRRSQITAENWLVRTDLDVPSEAPPWPSSPFSLHLSTMPATIRGKTPLQQCVQSFAHLFFGVDL